MVRVSAIFGWNYCCCKLGLELGVICTYLQDGKSNAQEEKMHVGFGPVLLPSLRWTITFLF